jgi:hypothetical protein
LPSERGDSSAVGRGRAGWGKTFRKIYCFNLENRTFITNNNILRNLSERTAVDSDKTTKPRN